LRVARAGYAKSSSTRAQILAAALEEAGATGLHNTSVAGIAKRANTAVGSLNYHFGSRKNLLKQAMSLLIKDLYVRLASVDAESGLDFFDRYRAELLAFVGYVGQNPNHIRLADEIKFLEPDLYRMQIADWVGLVRTKLEQGIAEGALRPLDEAQLTATAYYLVGSRQFLEDMVAAGHRDDDLVDAFIDLIRDGLAKPTPRRTRR
jgi:AcrR family transcriptional regulator